MLPKDYKGFTLSANTMKIEHLLRKFIDFANETQIQRDLHDNDTEQEKLNRLHKLQKEANYLLNLMEYAEELNEQEELEMWAESASYLWGQRIWDLLNELAPENCYFGSQVGDGARFGFWEFPDDTREIRKMWY